MPAPIDLPGSVTRYQGVTHFSAKFPVEKTACGIVAPAAALWRYVTCVACLRAGPNDPRIKALLEQRLKEEADRTRQDGGG